MQILGFPVQLVGLLTLPYLGVRWFVDGQSAGKDIEEAVVSAAAARGAMRQPENQDNIAPLNCCDWGLDYVSAAEQRSWLACMTGFKMARPVCAKACRHHGVGGGMSVCRVGVSPVAGCRQPVQSVAQAVGGGCHSTRLSEL